MRGIPPIRSRYGPRRRCAGGDAAAKPPLRRRPQLPLPHPWLRPALRRTCWPNARARPVTSGPRTLQGPRSRARSGRPARPRRSCCCAGCRTDTVDPCSVPASTDAQRSWGPLELGDRARGPRPGLVEGAPCRSGTRVCWSAHVCGLCQPAVCRTSARRTGHSVARYLNRTTADTLWKRDTGHGPGGPARGRHSPRPDHAADHTARARVRLWVSRVAARSGSTTTPAGSRADVIAVVAASVRAVGCQCRQDGRTRSSSVRSTGVPSTGAGSSAVGSIPPAAVLSSVARPSGPTVPNTV